jgi:type III pantothenate kinase
MIICLDVGNTNIFGGVFQNEAIVLRFRYNTRHNSTSDELGLFLKEVLRENNIDHAKISHIAICSVVPSIDYSLHAACKKYFKIEPFNLHSGVKNGLNILCKPPEELGADRIATAIAATHNHPDQNLIVIDLGTATTFCAITRKRDYLSGAIMPGIKISMEALGANAAKLSAVEIVVPKIAVGRTTAENIQSGLYYGQLGAMRELIKRFTEEVFTDQPPVVIGTGGFAHLFQESEIFDFIEPDLVLHGLRIALKINLGH